MICNKCHMLKHSILMQSVQTECKKCNETLYGDLNISYTYCDTCSNDLDKCIVCGKDPNKFLKLYFKTDFINANYMKVLFRVTYPYLTYFESNKTKYIAFLYDLNESNLHAKWVIKEISNKELLELLCEEKSIRQVFKENATYFMQVENGVRTYNKDNNYIGKLPLNEMYLSTNLPNEENLTLHLKDIFKRIE